MKTNIYNEFKEITLKYETTDVYKLKEIIEEKFKNKEKEKEMFLTEFKKLKPLIVIEMIVAIIMVFPATPILTKKIEPIITIITILTIFFSIIIIGNFKIKKSNKLLKEKGFEVKIDWFDNKIVKEVKILEKEKEIIEKITEIDNEIKVKINFENEIKELTFKYGINDINKLKEKIEEKLEYKEKENEIFSKEYFKIDTLKIIQLISIFFIVIRFDSILDELLTKHGIVTSSLVLAFFISTIIKWNIVKKTNKLLKEKGFETKINSTNDYEEVKESLIILLKEKQFINKIKKMKNEIN